MYTNDRIQDWKGLSDLPGNRDIQIDCCAWKHSFEKVSTSRKCAVLFCECKSPLTVSSIVVVLETHETKLAESDVGSELCCGLVVYQEPLLYFNVIVV